MRVPPEVCNNIEKEKVTMLAIRLARFGAKKKPTYRVVVIDKERARNSRSVEVVGHYNPIAKPAQVELNHERIEYWMKNGAQPSDTVSRLLKTNPAQAPAVA
jgi:small subunit ribosomal protein S16